MSTWAQALLLLVLFVTVECHYVPVEVSLVPDWENIGPLATCSNQTVVAVTIDPLVLQPGTVAATVVIKLGLDEVQLPDAVVFSAAGYTLAARSPGEVRHQQQHLNGGVRTVYTPALVHPGSLRCLYHCCRVNNSVLSIWKY